MVYYFKNSKHADEYVVLKEYANKDGEYPSRVWVKLDGKKYAPFSDRHIITHAALSFLTFSAAIPGFKLYDKMKIRNRIRADKGQDIVRVHVRDFFDDKLTQAEVEKLVAKLIRNKRNFTVVLDNNAESALRDGNERIEYNYSGEQIAELWEFNERLKKLGMKNSIRFNEFHETEEVSDLDKTFSLEQVIEANNEIDKIVETIRERSFSPYEAMVYIHKYLTMNFGYDYDFDIDGESGMEDYNKYNSIVGAIAKKKTVCVGFASLTKAIVDKLNMPGLSCDVQTVHFSTSEQKVRSHAVNIVTIDDKKYGFKGRFANDAQTDARSWMGPEGEGFAHMMFPLVDMENVKGHSTHTPSQRASRSVDYMDDIVDGAWSRVKGSSQVIPYVTAVRAIKSVYSKSSELYDHASIFDELFGGTHEPLTAEQAAERDIEISKYCAQLNFNDDAKNAFLQELNKQKPL